MCSRRVLEVAVWVVYQKGVVLLVSETVVDRVLHYIVGRSAVVNLDLVIAGGVGVVVICTL